MRITMNDIQQFGRIIKDIKFAMLSTKDEHGEICSRPMTLQQMEFDGELWFFFGKNSVVVKQIENSPRVNLTFAKGFIFLSASGQAEIVEDNKKEKELWNPMYKAWFPEGLEDPNLCLIKVSIESAEYWESPELKLVRLAGFAKAILQGKKDKPAAKHGFLN